MPCPASGTRFLDLNYNAHFVGHTKETGGRVVTRLWLGHLTARDELGNLSEYGKIILKRETENEGVD